MCNLVTLLQALARDLDQDAPAIGLIKSAATSQWSSVPGRESRRSESRMSVRSYTAFLALTEKPKLRSLVTVVQAYG